MFETCFFPSAWPMVSVVMSPCRHSQGLRGSLRGMSPGHSSKPSREAITIQGERPLFRDCY